MRQLGGIVKRGQCFKFREALKWIKGKKKYYYYYLFYTFQVFTVLNIGVKQSIVKGLKQ